MRVLYNSCFSSELEPDIQIILIFISQMISMLSSFAKSIAIIQYYCIFVLANHLVSELLD